MYSFSQSSMEKTFLRLAKYVVMTFSMRKPYWLPLPLLLMLESQWPQPYGWVERFWSLVMFDQTMRNQLPSRMTQLKSREHHDAEPLRNFLKWEREEKVLTTHSILSSNLGEILAGIWCPIFLHNTLAREAPPFFSLTNKTRPRSSFAKMETCLCETGSIY